ncbi:hypothetical protein MLD38_021828 [Melastoma candidum]|nr:hypothetical protein MLD38_021828 [Melastoma candidum]
MNINDAKSGSNQTVTWSTRSRQPDVAQGGNKQVGGSSDAGSKSSGGLSITKSASAKLVHGENVCKSSSLSPGSVKSAPSHPLMNANSKDHARGGGFSSVSDVPMTTSRDEKSTGSSQSHNNSHSCSSDHAKAGGIQGKEDARSSTAGSGKNLTGTSRHKKSVNGFSGSPASGREVGAGRNSSLNRGSVTEKASQSSLTSEKAVDVPAEVNSHKLIVKFSSRSRSPARNVSGGSLEEQPVMNSRASSPSPTDRPDQLDTVAKEKVDACQGIVSSEINAESWQSNDLKDVLMSCDDGGGSPNAVLDDERLKAGENLRKVLDASKSATLLSCRDFKSGRVPDASLGSINALVESCVKLSEPSVADSVMDDVGMNLLASVAAGEMTSEMTSPASSPQRNPSTVVQPFAGSDQTKISSADHSPGDASADTSTPQKIGDRGTSLTSAEEMKLSGEQTQGVETCTENVRNADEPAEAASVSENCLHKESKADVSLMSECKVEDDGSNVEVTKKEATEMGPASETKLIKPVPDDFKDVKKSEKSTDEQCSEDIGDSKCDGTADLTVTNVEHLANETEGKGEKKENIALCEVKPVGSSWTEGKGEKKENIALCEVKPVGSSCKILSELPIEDKIITANSGTHKLLSSVMDEKGYASSGAEPISLPSAEVSTMDKKVAFDLNEGCSADDGKYAEPMIPTSSARSTIHPLVNQLPFTASSVPTILPAPIPPAAAKGPFVPPNDFLRTKVEIGWKGSAATSAFRPAEPRKVLEMQLLTSGQHSDAGSCRQSRPPLNIDLNVPDEGMTEDAESRDSSVEMASLPKANCERTHNVANASSRGSGGLDLDLNQMDDATDIWCSSANISRRLDVALPSVKLSSVVRPGGVEAASNRDFDLNDGPAIDDTGTEPSTSNQQARSSLLSQQPVPTLKMNNSDLGSFSPWFPPGSTLSAVTIPSILPNRGDQPLPTVSAGGQPRMMGPSSGGIPFTHDVYRGSVLSSSHAISFPSTPFQYNVFPYGPSFPLPPASFSASSTTYIDPSSGGRLCFPPVHSQVLGASSSVTSPYIRPYVVSLQDGSNSFDNSKKWSRPGLDLNTGPGGLEAEGKEDTSSLAPREDQARMYQVTSGVLKRKEPEGGWDSYKQSSWQ